MLLLVLPGPGLLLVAAGLALLATEYEWARRLLQPVRRRALTAARAGVTSRWRLAGSVLTAVALAAAGVAWLPLGLPGGSAVTVGLVISALALLAVLGYAVHETRRPAAQ